MDKQSFFDLLGKSVGSKVEIINKSGINKGIYSSTVLDQKENLIGLAQPMYKGSWVQMSGMELQISVKIDNGFLEAPVVSRGTTFESLMAILWVEPIGDAVRGQRRSFVRIPCLFDADCCFLEIYSDVSESRAEAHVSKEWFSVTVNNISLGGMAATVKQGYDVDLQSRGRYLLAINLGGGLMFLNLLLRNLLEDSTNGMPSGAFAFGGLSVHQERAIGSFVRRQELAGKK